MLSFSIDDPIPIIMSTHSPRISALRAAELLARARNQPVLAELLAEQRRILEAHQR